MDDSNQKLLHVMVDAAAARFPERPALVDAERTVTYRELRIQADRVARRLASLGAGPERVIGIHLDRSAETVIAMLGVLKAGAAYVPLPTDYPADRLRFMLEDSRARQVVTRRGLGVNLPGDASRLLFIDDVLSATASDMEGGASGDSPARPFRGCHPLNLAYVIYTSGSTGTPKGVAVTHAGAANLVDPAQEYARFRHDEVFLQLAPLAFDASAFEIWGALTSGAKLVIPAPSYQAIEKLPAILEKFEITTLLLTPALFHVLMETRPDALDGIRRLLVGGDAMSVGWARAFAERAAHAGKTGCLRNAYGPTEGTTLVSYHPVESVAGGATGIPLGRPIEGAALYLLDEDLQRVGPNQRGQIYIAGTPVTRGYLHRPGLTSQCFLPDPFAGRPGARMYATGDVGVMRSDGQIEFDGRVDHQVKIRGHRIELREIEHVLRGHPAVQEACVVLVRSSNRAEHLVAYVVKDAAASVADLQEHLAKSLPPYMLPSRCVGLGAMPLTAAGKIDRTALAAMPLDDAASGDAAGESAVAVDTGMSPLETEMAAIWRDILRVDRVGPDDDFFSLGGDSLLAIRVIAEAEQRGLPLTLVQLFKNPTVRGVCSMLAEAAPEPAAAPDVLLQAQDRARLPRDVDAAYPATRLQLGMIYESLLSGGAFYVDVISREVLLPLDVDVLQAALGRLCMRHPILRTRFDLANFREPLQLVARSVTLPVERDDYRGLDAEESRRRHEAVMARLGEPFDPEIAPLMRMHASATADDRFRLSYSFHHALLDGWSESVFATELIKTYAAALRGEEIDFPDPAPFIEYVKLEREALADDASRRFFTELLASHAPSAERKPRVGTARYRKVSHRLPEEAARRLAVSSSRWELPTKSLLVAAYYAAVAAVLGRQGMVVGLSMNGRVEHAGGDLTLGLFLNHLPVRLETEGAHWRSLALHAFEAERALLPHRRFPYSEIQKLNGGAPFDVAFNYVHFRMRDELLHLGLVHPHEETRDHTSLPIRIEAVNDVSGEGFTIDVSVDTALYPESLAEELARSMAGTVQRMLDAPDAKVDAVR